MRLPAHHLLLAFGCLALLVAKAALLWRVNVNWDEFLYLSRVYDHQRGALATAFQTFHVHLFGWLPAVGGTEADQVVAGRVAAYVLRLGSTACVVLLGVRLYGRTGALFAAFATLAFPYLLRHGEALRADPVISFLFLAAAALLAWRMHSRAAVAAAAVLLATGLMVSVKTLIYAPAAAALVVLSAWRLEPPARRIAHMTLFTGVAVAAYVAMYLLHAGAALPSGPSVVARTVAVGAGMWMSPRWPVLAATLQSDWPFWALWAAGVGLAVGAAVRGRGDDRFRASVLLALQLPLASLLLYRNTFPYFFVTIVPLAALACGFAVDRLERVLAPRRAWIAPTAVIALAALPAIGALAFLSAHRHDMIAPQREVLAAIHEMYPEPVPYIDRGGMVASFPRVNMFMSTFVLARYRQRGEPVIERIVREGMPAFLVANVAGLGLHLQWEELQDSSHRLLRADFDFLQRTFIHHWGPIWVPGVTVEFADARGPVVIDLPVAGTYTVEAQGGAIVIDDEPAAAGAVVYLAAGRHTIAASDTVPTVTLRLGAHLPVPARAPPWWPLFIAL